MLEKYSPYAAVQAIRRDGLCFAMAVCSRTVYNYFYNGYIPDVTVKNLPMEGKRKRTYEKARMRIRKPLLRSIDERPKEIAKREDVGHWEMDTVVGKAKGKNPVLLVLTERKTRHELVFKIDGKKQEHVVAALDKLERKFRANFSQIFKTITMDNGCEFLNAEGLEQSILNSNKLRTIVYYCHPYTSNERASNENANRLVRRHVPKGEDISKYKHKDVRYIQDWMNNYPRKLFGGLSSNDVFAKCVQQELGRNIAM